MMVTLENEERPVSAGRKLMRLVALIMASGMVVFGLGIAVAGVVILFTETGLTAKVAVTLALGTAIAAAGGYWLHRQKLLAAWSGPVSDSVRKTRRVTVLSGLLGGIIGLVIALNDGNFNAFTNDPIDPAVAIIVTLAYVVLTPILALFWHRSADEFETNAYAQGALLAIYAYSLITPGWWMLTRAGILPPQDPMIVFLIIVAIWGVAWLVKKSD